MTQPITIDIPHQLGRAAARLRLEQGIGQIARAIPGASLTEHHWEGDTLSFAMKAMGQRVDAKLVVLDTAVHATLYLPPFVSVLANTMKSRFLTAGTKLLRGQPPAL